MKKAYFSIALIVCIVLLFADSEDPVEVQPDSKVAEIMYRLGDTVAERHKPDTSVTGISVEAGRNLVHTGRAEKPGGGTSSRVSKHFVCTSCHNIEREDPDLTTVNPEARLSFAVERDIPYLPATTFFGISNRETFYNGDYIEKYGEELVGKARHSLRESIQLCATECSQGRSMDPWEVESVVAYFWTLGFEIQDLDWKEGELEVIQSAMERGEDYKEARQLIRSKYLTYSPATFVDPPENRRKGNDLKGDPTEGKHIYVQSCMHCHENERYSMFDLDTTSYDLNYLERHIPEYDRYSIYQVIRYGTSPKYGKKAYMPHYTMERMNRQQIEDLRAYIEEGPDLSS